MGDRGYHWLLLIRYCGNATHENIPYRTVKAIEHFEGNEKGARERMADLIVEQRVIPPQCEYSRYDTRYTDRLDHHAHWASWFGWGIELVCPELDMMPLQVGVHWSSY